MKKHFKVSAIGVAVAALTFAIPLDAFATGETVLVGATSVTPGSSGNSLGVTLSGFNASASYIAIVSTSAGQLTLGNTTGITALFGYADLSLPSDTYGFEGTYGDVEAALTSLAMDAPSAAGDATVDITVTEAPTTSGSLYFYPANHHYYEYVEVPAGDISWGDARAAAASKTLLGMTGYLATLTDSAENDFIASKTSAVNVWIGAARSNANLDGSFNNPTDISDPAGLIWEWKTGPEAGTDFFQQTAWDTGGGSALGGAFSAWNTAGLEPNNYQYELSNGWHESFAVTNWQGSVGEWNDLPNTPEIDILTVPGYMVEYGGIGTSTASEASIAATVSVTDSNSSGGTQSGLPLTGLSAEKLLATTLLGAGFLALAFGSFNGRRRLREFALDDRLRSTLKRLDASLTRVEKRMSRSRRGR